MRFNGMTIQEYIFLKERVNKSPEEEQAFIEYNRALLERYPFLMVRYRDTDKPIKQCYVYTLLEELERGWAIGFGEELLEELREELIRIDYLNSFRITEIKEKFGSLRIYYEDIPMENKIQEIMDKYEEKSKVVCGRCGQRAKYLSNNWIYPYCEECAEETMRNMEKAFSGDITFEEAFKEIEES